MPRRKWSPLLIWPWVSLTPLSALAQQVPVTWSVDGVAAVSNNGAQAPAEQANTEVILSLRPRFSGHWRGNALDVDVEAALTVHTDIDSGQGHEVSPDVRAAFKARLIESALTLDGSAQWRPVRADPYTSSLDPASQPDRRIERLYRLSPQAELALGPDSSLLARADWTVIDNASGNGARRSTGQTLVRLARRPVPLGAALELTRIDSDAPDLPASRYDLSSLRLRSTYQWDQELEAELMLGRDVGHDASGRLERPLYGLGLRWVPGPRTAVGASLERRFFGYAGVIKLQHRMPWLAVALLLSRQPVVAPAALGSEIRTGDLRALLDGMLSTRHPDPVERQGQVIEAIDRRAIDVRLPDPTDAVAAYAQLQTRLEASTLLLGRRHALALNLYAQTVRQLALGGLLPLGVATGDSRQVGGMAQLSYRMAPQLTAIAAVQWARITGLAARTGDSSDDRAYRVSLQRQLTPSTAAVIGTEHRRFRTTVGADASFRETRVFCGISHRF